MEYAEMIAQARIERDRLVSLIATVEEVGKLQEAVQQDGLSDAAECIALDALVEAEDRLVALVCNPGLVAYLAHVAQGLSNVLRIRTAVEALS